MSQNDSQQIVNKAWNFAHVLRDDGLSYMAYTEQITFLLFLKMADEQTKPPYNKPPIVPPNIRWTGHAFPACTHACLFASQWISLHPSTDLFRTASSTDLLTQVAPLDDVHNG